MARLEVALSNEGPGFGGNFSEPVGMVAVVETDDHPAGETGQGVGVARAAGEGGAGGGTASPSRGLGGTTMG